MDHVDKYRERARMERGDLTELRVEVERLRTGIASLSIKVREAVDDLQEARTAQIAAEMRVRIFTEALQKYGRHHEGKGIHGCNIFRSVKTDGQCSCGLRAALILSRE